MPGPEPSKRVNVLQQDSGVLVPIARKQLIEMGVDPDDPDLEVNRNTFKNSDRSEMRLRFYNSDD